MKTKKKLQLLSLLVMAVVLIPFNYFVVNWGNAFNSIGQLWPIITENNQSLLATLGIKWWLNHTALVTFQIVALFLVILFANYFMLGVMMIAESIAKMSAFSIKKDFELKDGMEDCFVLLYIDSYPARSSNGDLIKYFVKISLTKIFFFIIFPLTFSLYFLKYTSKVIFNYLDPIMD